MRISTNHWGMFTLQFLKWCSLIFLIRYFVINIPHSEWWRAQYHSLYNPYIIYICILYSRKVWARKSLTKLLFYSIKKFGKWIDQPKVINCMSILTWMPLVWQITYVWFSKLSPAKLPHYWYSYSYQSLCM